MSPRKATAKRTSTRGRDRTAPAEAPKSTAPESGVMKAAAPQGTTVLGRRCVPHPDSELTREQAQLLCRMLLDKRRDLLREHEEHLDVGRTAERVAEAEEAAALDTSQSTLIDLAESERQRLTDIERALHRLEEGTYGVSEESGEPIGFDRLRAIPWARLSVADQEDRERRFRTGERR